MAVSGSQGSHDWLIDAPEETLTIMRLFGHVRLGSDGVHELTQTGSAWLQAWCNERLAERDVSGK